MCFIVYTALTLHLLSVVNDIPLTKPSLKKCIEENKCQPFRPETNTHVSFAQYFGSFIELSL